MRCLLLLLVVGCGGPKDDSKPVPAEEPKPGALDRAKPTRPGADWPTFLGPTRDGVSAEKGILTTWPKDGLKKLWECDLGQGYFIDIPKPAAQVSFFNARGRTGSRLPAR